VSEGGAARGGRAALDAALDVVHAQLALGHPGFEADGARFVRDPAFPRIYDANFVWRVEAATPEALERLLARVEREYASVGHRAFRLDPRTPPQVAARLALEGYESQDSLVMLLEGEPPGSRAAPCQIRAAEVEDDWAALAALKRDDFAEAFRRREPGKPVDLAIGDGLAGANRGKCPPQRYWLAAVDGVPCGFLASWEGAGGTGQVEDLFVAPPFRRRGIARALLLHGVADARGRGARDVTIVADPTDTPMRLYAALGFRPLAVCSLYRKDASV
jgi:ribosomal protein S18 acetylase RimI-like enzyme